VTLLGIDTSTPPSAACVLRVDGSTFEVEPDPARLHEGPAHARELMPAVAEVMERAGVEYGDLQAIAVGVGPGTFTGLRIGIATARALASASGLPLRPVSSLAALAEGMREEAAPPSDRRFASAAAADDRSRLPLIDARRGELFAALFDPAGAPLWKPFVAAPEAVVERVRDAGFSTRAAGDGSIRFRGVLEAAGIGVDADESRSHVVRALHVCRLALAAPDQPPEAVLPDYLRTPDAKPSS
jgi:tRNA threonylcarbamoyladenosine biosynthesis protein TsaB